MKSVCLLFLSLAFSLLSHAQRPFKTDIRNYDWSEDNLTDPQKFSDSGSSHYTYYYTHLQYDLGGYNFQELFCYRLVHFVVWVNDDQTIEHFNRYSVEYNHYTEEIRKIKARVVKNGKVLANTTRDDLMKGDANWLDGISSNNDDLEDKLVIKGLEKGCYLEFVLLLEYEPYMYSSQGVMNIIPIKKLVAVFQSYGEMGMTVSSVGIPNELLDTTIKGKQYIFVEADDVPASLEQNFSFGYNQGIHFETSLNQTDITDVTTRWQNEGAKIAEMYVGNVNVYKAQLEKILSTLNIDSLPDDISKAFAIESYVKKNYTIDPKKKPDVLDMISSGSGSQSSYISLIAQLCLRADIDIELLMTCDRTQNYFNPDFFSLLYTQRLLIHILGTDYYIQPAVKSSRISVLPENFLGQNALSAIVRFNSPEKYTVSVVKLPGDTYVNRVDSACIVATLNPKDGKCRLDLTRTFWNTQNMIRVIAARPEQKTNFAGEYLKSVYGSVCFDTVTISNTNNNDLKYVLQPFVISSKMTVDNLVKTSSDKIVLNAGMLIGKQNYYKADSVRMAIIDVNEPKIYKRMVKIEIPKGYKVGNLDDLQMNKVVNLPNQKPAFGFISKARVEGSYVIIECEEYICRASFPAFMYTEFISTTNMAAEFNQRQIVFTRM